MLAASCKQRFRQNSLVFLAEPLRKVCHFKHIIRDFSDYVLSKNSKKANNIVKKQKKNCYVNLIVYFCKYFNTQ